MNNDQIDSILFSNPEARGFFQGTYAADTLPNCPTRPAFLVNTAKISSEGKHWVAFYAQGSTVFYFDPLGEEPPHDILKWLKRRYTRIIANKSQLQAYGTKTCGIYCIIFLYKMCIGLPFYDVIKFFQNIDDLYVIYFLKAKFNFDLPVTHAVPNSI